MAAAVKIRTSISMQKVRNHTVSWSMQSISLGKHGLNGRIKLIEAHNIIPSTSIFKAGLPVQQCSVTMVYRFFFYRRFEMTSLI